MFQIKKIRLYCQKCTLVPVIADTMVRDRFFKLQNNLKAVDNTRITKDEKAADRLWKVCPFVDKIRKACLSLPRENNVCIDEQIILFTWRCPTWQYVQWNPHLTGLKNFLLTGASGIVLGFVIYQGERLFRTIVWMVKLSWCAFLNHLVKDISYSVIFFTTLAVILNLKEKGIMVTSTINKKSIPKSVKFSGDNDM